MGSPVVFRHDPLPTMSLSQDDPSAIATGPRPPRNAHANSVRAEVDNNKVAGPGDSTLASATLNINVVLRSCPQCRRIVKPYRLPSRVLLAPDFAERGRSQPQLLVRYAPSDGPFQDDCHQFSTSAHGLTSRLRSALRLPRELELRPSVTRLWSPRRGISCGLDASHPRRDASVGLMHDRLLT